MSSKSVPLAVESGCDQALDDHNPAALGPSRDPPVRRVEWSYIPVCQAYVLVVEFCVAGHFGHSRVTSIAGYSEQEPNSMPDECQLP